MKMGKMTVHLVHVGYQSPMLLVTFWSGKEINKNDVCLFDVPLQQQLNGLDNGGAGVYDRIEKQHLSQRHVVGQFGVEDAKSGLLRIKAFILFNDDLANTNRPTGVTQSLLHGLARADDRHAAVRLGKADSLVGATRWRGHRLGS